VIQTESRQTTEMQIGFLDILAQLTRYKVLVLLFMVMVSSFSVWIALKMPNVYQTVGIFAPATDKKSGLGGLGSQIGGLASLAGISLSAGGAVDKTDLAIELLRSKDFISRFIQKYDLKVLIMAADGWDMNSNQIRIDQEKYDTENKIWLRTPKAPRLPEPSYLEAAEEFSKLLDVSKDKTTSMVKITLEYYSPVLAKNWLDLLVEEVNEEIRQRDVLEAKASIDYLNNQLATINIADIRESVIQIIQDQTKTLMLTNIRKEYALKTVDPAFIPEEKFKPRRAIIVIMSVFSAFLLLMFAAYLKISLSFVSRNS